MEENTPASLLDMHLDYGGGKGIEGQDQAMFNRGLKGLKTYFLINGALAIFGLLSIS